MHDLAALPLAGPTLITGFGPHGPVSGQRDSDGIAP